MVSTDFGEAEISAGLDAWKHVVVLMMENRWRMYVRMLCTICHGIGIEIDYALIEIQRTGSDCDSASTHPKLPSAETR